MSIKNILEKQFVSIQASVGSILTFFSTAKSAQINIAKAKLVTIQESKEKLSKWEQEAIKFNASLDDDDPDQIDVIFRTSSTYDSIETCLAKFYSLEEDLKIKTTSMGDKLKNVNLPPITGPHWDGKFAGFFLCVECSVL